MTVFRLLPIALLGGALLLAAQGSGETVLVSDLAAANDGSGPAVGLNDWWAQGFQTPSDATYLLTSVSLKLASATPLQGTFSLDLWDASGSGGAPGSRIATLSSSNLVSAIGSDFTDSTYNVATPVRLAPASTYYLVVRASAPFQDSGLYWGSAQDQTPVVTGAGKLLSWTESLDQGKTWDFLDATFPFQMAIRGTIALANPDLTLSAQFVPTNSVLIAWPTGFPTVHLQSTPSLSPTNWTNVGVAAVTNGTRVQVILPALNGSEFFRLR